MILHHCSAYEQSLATFAYKRNLSKWKAMSLHIWPPEYVHWILDDIWVKLGGLGWLVHLDLFLVCETVTP